MKSLAAALPVLLLLLALPRDAAAYIDPGTGSLLLQGLIAGLAAAAAVMRAYWYRIKSFFRRGQPAGAPKAPAAEDAAKAAENAAKKEEQPGDRP